MHIGILSCRWSPSPPLISPFFLPSPISFSSKREAQPCLFLFLAGGGRKMVFSLSLLSPPYRFFPKMWEAASLFGGSPPLSYLCNSLLFSMRLVGLFLCSSLGTMPELCPLPPSFYPRPSLYCRSSPWSKTCRLFSFLFPSPPFFSAMAFTCEVLLASATPFFPFADTLRTAVRTDSYLRRFTGHHFFFLSLSDFLAHQVVAFLCRAPLPPFSLFLEIFFSPAI